MTVPSLERFPIPTCITHFTGIYCYPVALQSQIPLWNSTTFKGVGSCDQPLKMPIDSFCLISQAAKQKKMKQILSVQQTLKGDRSQCAVILHSSKRCCTSSARSCDSGCLSLSKIGVKGLQRNQKTNQQPPIILISGYSRTIQDNFLLSFLDQQERQFL